MPGPPPRTGPVQSGGMFGMSAPALWKVAKEWVEEAGADKVKLSVTLVLVLASGWFVWRVIAQGAAYVSRASVPPHQVPTQPAEERDYRRSELADFGGGVSGRPVLLACKGKVFDVSMGRDFYGVEGPYNCFAGREANRALGMMSLKLEDCVPDTAGLSPDELSILDDWYEKFCKKYPVMGNVID